MKSTISAGIAALALVSSAPAIDVAQFIDALTARVTYSSGMDLENAPAEFDYTELSLMAFLSQPKPLGGDWHAIAYLDLKVSEFDFEGNPLIGTFGDDLESNLYHVGVPFVFYHTNDSSRWTYGAWINPAISSDFQSVDDDDFYLGAAIAGGYQVNDCFVIGGGVYVSDMFHDASVYPGLGFVWTPTEDWLVTYYGPRFVARRDINHRNQLGLEVAYNGGTWNVDANTLSSQIDYSSWRTGLYYRYNVTGEVWLEAAAGFTFANEFNLESRGGNEIFPTLGDAESGVYGFLGVSVARW
ncbi:DUF6268 family outer membrane beta-barrel protein [Haloferula chungangensis]|uniref:DUF6268 family outer membrane beta-barrel protein n=1 Tax=Haloferula chungangensis TaxID=1048331 RepID=A0ABW2L974_9BACT